MTHDQYNLCSICRSLCSSGPLVSDDSALAYSRAWKRTQAAWSRCHALRGRTANFSYSPAKYVHWIAMSESGRRPSRRCAALKKASPLASDDDDDDDS